MGATLVRKVGMVAIMGMGNTSCFIITRSSLGLETVGRFGWHGRETMPNGGTRSVRAGDPTQSVGSSGA
jgi:hypothetical protein